jgi:outer membrane protein assembly factor BamB
MIPRTPLMLIAAGGLLAAGPQSSGEDWPRWRGPELNGISREKGWTTDWPGSGPRKLWQAAVGIGFSSVTVADGRVFTLGNTNETDTVYCFDAVTGKPIWNHAYPCPLDATYYEGGPGSTPTVDGGRVYTLGKRGQLFCFDAASGNVIWQKNLIDELGVTKPRWGFAGSPLVEDHWLILNVGGAGTAVDKATGKVVWLSDTNAAGYATPVPFMSGTTRAAAIFSARALVGVRVGDGKELWRHPWVTKWDINIADPIPAGDRLFVSSFDRGCALLDSKSGTEIWANKNIGNHFNSCVLLDGFLYGVDGNSDQEHKDLRCLDWKTGGVKWTYQGLGLASVLVADGKLMVLSDRGELVVAPASPEGFKPLARAQVLGGKCWTVPVLANGRIYCRNAQGTIVCLDVSKPGS